MKRRTLIILALFPFVVVAILLLALLTLDLNPYRGQVVWSLEQAFSQPVKLNALELAFHNGLALELSGLEVGEENSNYYFRTEQGVFRLQLIPLFSGQLVFDEIFLKSPFLQLQRQKTTTDPQQAAPPAAPLFANLPQLKTLQLSNATLELHNFAVDLPFIRLSELDLSMRGLHPGQHCEIDLNGVLGDEQHTIPLDLHANVPIPGPGDPWFTGRHEIRLAARQVTRSLWTPYLPETLNSLLPESPVDLHLLVSQPESGRFSATLTIENAAKSRECRTPNLTLNLEDASFSGNLTSRAEELDISLEGRGSLESCGEQLANFDFNQTLQRKEARTLFDSRLHGRVVTEKSFPKALEETTDLKISGPLPVNLHVHGDSHQADWEATGDFSNVAMYVGTLLVKTPGIAGKVSARGSLGDVPRKLQSAELELGPLSADLKPLEGKVQGFLLQLKPTRLEQLEEVLPALTQWSLRGSMQGRFSFRKERDRWRRAGTLELTDLAAEHPYPLGPVRSTHARLELTDNSLSFSCRPLGLGDSQLSVRGEVADLTAPSIVIHAGTERMLARDLVFKNPEANLHELSGTLRIDGDGIDFTGAKVRLDNGTRADVDGRLDFHANRLHLDARASYAHIDEIIALFSGPPHATEFHRDYAPPADRPPFRVVVDALAAQGEIDGVSFTNARGTVTVEHGNVEVYPLTFNGEGRGDAVARVYYAHRNDQPGWLRVSGNLSGFESSSLYRQYMRQQGEIKGPLDCDFFLQGPSDADFFKRGDGAVYFEIRDGSLRRFNVLAKAFSLLNVSQLFRGELPDMTGSGLKFKRLGGTLSFGGGYVYSDDLSLFSSSLNMSIVGRRDLGTQQNDYILGVQPLQTVDKVVSNIPLVGWVLTGDEKTLFTVHFQVKGSYEDPEVVPIPGSSLGSGILGIFQRTLRLPGKLVGE